MTITPSQRNDLTIVLSRLNRYEIECKELLAGPPGLFVREVLERAGYRLEQTTVTSDLVYPATPKVLCLGTQAAQYFNFKGDLSVTRGFVRGVKQQFCATYLPIDCVDVVDFESDLFDLDDEDDGGETTTFKDTAPTSRANYCWWFEQDVRKLLLNERRLTYPTQPRIQLTQDQLISQLNGYSNTELFLDIETYPNNDTIQCWAFAFGVTGTIISVPTYDHTGASAYDNARVFAALARALGRNTTVAHNIMFDLPFLFQFHGVPFSTRLADTMLMHHRFFPEAEKSLAHLLSYWLNVESHKGDGIFHCYNAHQYRQLLEYNAKDVLATRAIYYAQLDRADACTRKSIEQVNRSIYPYMLASCTGYEVDSRARSAGRLDATNNLTQLRRAFKILVGSDMNTNSPKQIAEWLYDGLGYPVKAKTDSGAPATDAKTLYSLVAKHPENVALRLLLLIRDAEKTTSMLDFVSHYQLEERTA